MQVRRFVQNLLVDVNTKTGGHRSSQMVYESFREHVASYKRLAKYTDPDGEEVDVLTVKLKTPHKLERARTMQRNFAATYLKDPDRHGREAALVAYYADGTDDWRLSFVQMEYRTVVDEESGDVKAEEALTPVRYTFLVGENEPTHTPKRQFAPLLQSEELRFPPTLDEIKEAFDIEVVTDAFFEAYRGHHKTLMEDVKTALADDETAHTEFDEKDVTPDAFAEKLMGQLVFLYFLQKKGWLGVQRGDDWGEGPGNFLRQLYEGAYVDYENFYRDVLEPLFYQGLAVGRGGNNYFSALRCRVPFLNGGLFQPIHNVDRSRVHLSLPNETFGDIFDTFDRYNFTVREDEPLDKEVAVDPEMLGKVFEKMLDADQRKENGAFYTPRDAVHYMCQQSLIDHLDTKLSVHETPLRNPAGQQGDAFGNAAAPKGVLTGEDDDALVKRPHLEALLRDGTNWIEHDARVRESEATEGKYSEYEAPRPIRRHAEALDAILADVKVCDPAVGSGGLSRGRDAGDRAGPPRARYLHRRHGPLGVRAQAPRHPALPLRRRHRAAGHRHCPPPPLALAGGGRGGLRADPPAAQPALQDRARRRASADGAPRLQQRKGGSPAPPDGNVRRHGASVREGAASGQDRRPARRPAGGGRVRLSALLRHGIRGARRIRRSNWQPAVRAAGVAHHFVQEGEKAVRDVSRKRRPVRLLRRAGNAAPARIGGLLLHRVQQVDAGRLRKTASQMAGAAESRRAHRLQGSSCFSGHHCVPVYSSDAAGGPGAVVPGGRG
jgi:hypothetical protein